MKDAPASVARSHARVPSWPWLAALLALHSLLVLEQWFVSDDAYINFRFARNLALGLGFVYNPGVDGPIEGTSELFWVLLLTPIEALGWNVERAACLIGVTCSFGLLLRLERTLRVDLGFRPTAVVAGTLFVAAMPVFSTWSTGGLSTMAFAWLLFELYRALIVDERPRPIATIFGVVLALTLRAESLPWIIGLCTVSLWSSRGGRHPRRARLARRCAAAALLGTVALVGIRLAYFGYPLPNTAYAKVGFNLDQARRGLGYIARFFVVFPAVAVAALWIAAGLFRRFGNARAMAAAPSTPLEGALAGAGVCIAASLAFSLTVGGDFMAMFRFATPAIAFGGLLLAWCTASRGRVAFLAALALCLANLPAAFGVEPLMDVANRLGGIGGRRQPQSVELFWQRHNSKRWSELGRALKDVAPAHASLVARGIGAVGYHSGLTIHDRHGLISGEVSHGAKRLQRGAAGHDLFVPIAFFDAHRPTYAYAGLHTAKELERPGPLLLHRLFGEAGDEATHHGYRPVVIEVPWILREDRWLLLAERLEDDCIVAPVWTGSLRHAGQPRDLPGPSAIHE